ncbi:MAG: AraC family transcriptional regulator [Chitinophagaceae bacterium]
MKLYIKYMVSHRCKMVVRELLKRLGITYLSISLGEVKLTEEIPDHKREQIREGLKTFGLELMDDKKAVLVETIKDIIIEMVHYNEELPRFNFSDLLSEKLNYNYTYLANLFSETVGVTIEHYIISHKIERVKELIIYDELNLTEIAYQLHYSSVSHLSNQFKKVTGLTPSFFRSLKDKKRCNLENI